MRRLLLGGLGAYLLMAPAQMSYRLLWPVPPARNLFLVVGLTLYGGGAIGALIAMFRRVRKSQRTTRTDVVAGVFSGAMIGVVVAFVLASIQAGEMGNIGPALVIVGGIYGAFLSAGAGFLWTAIARA